MITSWYMSEYDLDVCDAADDVDLIIYLEGFIEVWELYEICAFYDVNVQDVLHECGIYE